MDGLWGDGHVFALVEHVLLDALDVPGVVARDLLRQFERQEQDLLAALILAALPGHHDLGAHGGNYRVEDRLRRGAFTVAGQDFGSP